MRLLAFMTPFSLTIFRTPVEMISVWQIRTPERLLDQNVQAKTVSQNKPTCQLSAGKLFELSGYINLK